MTRRRLVVGLAIGVLAVGAAFAALRTPAVQDRLIAAVVERAVAGPGPADFLFEDDALRVLVCGSASPLPHATRAGPCVAVFAGGLFYVVDAGPRSWNRMALWRVDASRIGAVLLTHFHSDHIGGLGEWNLQSWIAGRPEPLPVVGPPGVERVVAGFREAYALDTAYRNAHHGPEVAPLETASLEARPVPGPAAGSGPAVAWRAGELTVTAFAVDHAPAQPAYGYRFDYRGRSVVVSGDTAKREEVVRAAQGADVLVHEAQANHLVALLRETAARAGRDRLASILGDIPDYHTSPVEAAEVAEAAGAKLLVMVHLTPPPPTRWVERVFVRGVDAVRPEGWVLADDGLVVELPVGSSEGASSEVRTLRLE